MAGLSDSPGRRIARRAGSPESITEFVPAREICKGSEKPLALFRYHEEERPVIFQYFGNNADEISEAALRTLHLGPDGIDLNLGCSSRKVVHHGSGAAMLKDPPLVAATVRQLVRKTGLPVSVKMRIGWDAQNLNYSEIARIAEAEGACRLAVHGRTRDMKYSGEADWQAIARVKESVQIPVYGNGDISTPAQAEAKAAESGVDGVFIGRGAIGNPWIFSRRDKSKLNLSEKMKVVNEHYRLMCEFYTAEQGMLLFRKHLLKYLAGEPEFERQRLDLLTCDDTFLFADKLAEMSELPEWVGV